jgi:hypothetical protein
LYPDFSTGLRFKPSLAVKNKKSAISPDRTYGAHDAQKWVFYWVLGLHNLYQHYTRIIRLLSKVGLLDIENTGVVDYNYA